MRVSSPERQRSSGGAVFHLCKGAARLCWILTLSSGLLCFTKGTAHITYSVWFVDIRLCMVNAQKQRTKPVVFLCNHDATIVAQRVSDLLSTRSMFLIVSLLVVMGLCWFHTLFSITFVTSGKLFYWLGWTVGSCSSLNLWAGTC